MRYLGLLTFLLSAGGAQANTFDYSHRTTLNSNSVANGIGSSSYYLLQRNPGPGATAVTNNIIAAFSHGSGGISTAGSYHQETIEQGQLLTAGTGWYLVVSADGFSAQYRNQGYYYANTQRLPTSNEPSPSTLQTWGTNFINSNLSSFVPLGSQETMVAYHGSNQELNQGFVPAGAGSRPQNLSTLYIDSLVVFARTKNNLDIVGPGSKITVNFTSTGQAFGFNYDWPSYTTTTTSQTPLGVAAILTRDTADTLVKFQASAAHVTQPYFECGYFEEGNYARVGSTALVQGGCVWQRIGSITNAAGNVTRHGGIDVTPTASIATLSTDDTWPQVYFIKHGTQLPLPGTDPGLHP